MYVWHNVFTEFTAENPDKTGLLMATLWKIHLNSYAVFSECMKYG